MTVPSPPDEHYLWLGRITTAAAMLELQLGALGWAAKTGQVWTDDWAQIAGSPGTAVKLCKQAVRILPQTLADQVEALLKRAEEVRLERHRLTHAVFTLDPTRPTGEQWVLRAPSNSSEFQPLTEARAAQHVASMNRLSREAGMLRATVADHVRTPRSS